MPGMTTGHISRIVHTALQLNKDGTWQSAIEAVTTVWPINSQPIMVGVGPLADNALDKRTVRGRGICLRSRVF